MIIDFNDRKFTIIAVLFLFFCIYKAGYFEQKVTPVPKYESQANKEYVGQAKYKITLDPTKPEEEMTIWEKGIIYFLKNRGNALPKIVSAKGDIFLIRYTETIDNQIIFSSRDQTVTLGEGQVPDYIEGVLYVLEEGETKQYNIKDKETGKLKSIQVTVIEKTVKGKNK